MKVTRPSLSMPALRMTPMASISEKAVSAAAITPRRQRPTYSA
eukprot:CAMPEP_0181194574 /NCGR_PEP_ID=MMETSP1096-20121128/14413_1 /TAXON_ID=156174 ORGANISM="Chrysochromulina ericina, Strain CCMP281" /NCGR_SAMPLE_ID=MMETSP1096 /ASSEMBLY_ACC=CAM_ASM_000453 /LENGTH=42 /DNA_ID= /DNA_START= /DNA_END= /DNA_ORIENTATION=